MLDKDEIVKELLAKNKELQDENESLWGMLEEIKESDSENWMQLVEKLKKDAMIRALMTSETGEA